MQISIILIAFLLRTTALYVLDKNMKARRVLSVYFLLENELTNISSLTGAQLEQLRDRLFPKRMIHTDTRIDQLRIEFVDLSLLLRELTKEEMDICRLRYGRRVGIRNYERFVPIHDVQKVYFFDGSIEMLTKQGESLVDLATLPNGEEIKGWATVSGRAAKQMTFEDIAKALNLSLKQVRQLCTSACEKVAKALRKRTMEAA